MAHALRKVPRYFSDFNESTIWLDSWARAGRNCTQQRTNHFLMDLEDSSRIVTTPWICKSDGRTSEYGRLESLDRLQLVKLCVKVCVQNIFTLKLPYPNWKDLVAGLSIDCWQAGSLRTEINSGKIIARAVRCRGWKPRNRPTRKSQISSDPRILEHERSSFPN